MRNHTVAVSINTASSLAAASGSSLAAAAAPCLATLAILSAPSIASASIVQSFEVGAGGNTSTFQVDFQNGNGYLINFHWSDATTDGWDAMLAIDAAQAAISLEFDTFSWGVMLTGITIGADHDYGNGDQWPTVENYWHYWTKDSGDWASSWVGASDDQLFDGSWDAWVFGSPAAPQAVPAPSVLVSLAMIGIGIARRRR